MSRPSVILYLTPFSAAFFTYFLLPSTDIDDDPLHARWFVYVFRSSILRIFRTWVLGLLSVNIDGYAGRSIIAMAVRRETSQPHTYSKFPNFLYQPFFCRTVATYGPLKSRRTVDGSVGHHFYNFQHNSPTFSF